MGVGDDFDPIDAQAEPIGGSRPGLDAYRTGAVREHPAEKFRLETEGRVAVGVRFGWCRTAHFFEKCAVQKGRGCFRAGGHRFFRLAECHCHGSVIEGGDPGQTDAGGADHRAWGDAQLAVHHRGVAGQQLIRRGGAAAQAIDRGGIR